MIPPPPHTPISDAGPQGKGTPHFEFNLPPSANRNAVRRPSGVLSKVVRRRPVESEREQNPVKRSTSETRFFPVYQARRARALRRSSGRRSEASCSQKLGKELRSLSGGPVKKPEIKKKHVRRRLLVRDTTRGEENKFPSFIIILSLHASEKINRLVLLPLCRPGVGVFVLGSFPEKKRPRDSSSQSARRDWADRKYLTKQTKASTKILAKSASRNPDQIELCRRRHRAQT